MVASIFFQRTMASNKRITLKKLLQEIFFVEYKFSTIKITSYTIVKHPCWQCTNILSELHEKQKDQFLNSIGKIIKYPYEFICYLLFI